MNKYEKIIEVLCDFKGISKEKLIFLLSDRNYKYLLFLFLKNYKCMQFDDLKRDFSIESKKSISYNCKKAKEKFFINKDFREMYFEVEEIINKII